MYYFLEVTKEFGKDTETLQWTLESAEVDLWVEPPDPVLDAVAKIVSAESPLWNGTATELVALLGIDMKPKITSALTISSAALRIPFIAPTQAI